MMIAMKLVVRRTISTAMLAGLLCAAGCKNFFPPLNGTGSGSGTTNIGDYVYVVSSNTSSASDPIYTVSGFSVGTNALTALTGSPLTLGFAPTAVAINPANSYLYAAGATVLTGIVYGYSVASSGVLTAVNTTSSSPVLGTANVVSMVVSPDGKWLLALDRNSNLVVVDEYAIDSSTGLLTPQTGVQYALTGTSATIVPNSIAVSPNGDYVAVAVGTGGDVLFNFNTSTGALTFARQVNPPTASSADQALTFDSTSSILYVARSGTDSGVVPYTISSGGGLTAVSGAPFSLGTSSNASGPASILIDKSGDYLYVGNKTTNTISGFSIASGGVLTALASSPYPGGTTVTGLAFDNSGKYIFSTALGGNPDLKMFGFDATALGQLDAAAIAATGTSDPAGAVAVAATH